MGASFRSMPPRLRSKTVGPARGAGERPRARPKPRAMPTATAKAAAKAAAKALAEKNSRRHERREACKSLNELARTLLVPAHNLVDAMNAAATDVEDLVKLVEKRVKTFRRQLSRRDAAGGGMSRREGKGSGKCTFPERDVEARHSVHG